jgi:hypothetical protein
VGNFWAGYSVVGRWQNSPRAAKEFPMARSLKANPVPATRAERIEEIMQQLRPKVEEAVRKLVERAIDVPEHEEFGAIEYEYREAGLNLANDVRQVTLASRKKRGTSGAAWTAAPALTWPNSTPGKRNA